MKRIVVISSVVIVLMLVGLGIVLATRSNGNDKALQKIEIVKRGDFVIKVNASGNLESLLSVEVKSNVEGEIEKLYVKEGDFIEKGSILLKIDDEQIREEMKQAEANVSAAEAQLEQAKRSLAVKGKQLESELQQQRDNVAQAQMSYNVAKATTLQQLSQQETDIQNTKESLEQDRIALRQAEIALTQAELSLSDAEQGENAAKVDMDNAESELKRTQELYAKKFVSEKSLEDAQASSANANSRYETAQKRVLSQKETVQSQKETIAIRKGAIQMRDTTLEFEKQNLEMLKQTRAVQEEQAQTQLNIARTRLTQLEENINDEKDISRFSLEGTKANLLRAQSTLNNQKERLGWTTIIAPMSGIIINLQLEEGEIVTSGRSAFSQSPPLMEIVDLSQMVVKTFINEVDMEKLKLGQKTEIRVRAYPDRTYRGEVREISPSGQPRDNIIYFEVLIAVLGSPKELRPGMTTDVDIVVVERPNALLLPIEAVKSERATARGGRPGETAVNPLNDTTPDTPAARRRDRQHYVMLAPQGEKDAAAKSVRKSHQRQGLMDAVGGVKTFIEVGETNDTEIELLSGLREGDRVLVQNAPQAEAEQSNQRRRR
ncbi:HlyD family efflux transporter periplasmic adaptor subunit [Candidatus Poribacteria bacterium]|nr:HlyD family efflux transporter periplasmic adaptor subunit [Candidatus Poribacteria bacterium]